MRIPSQTDSSSELREESPAQIGKDETEGQCRCIVSPKELPSSQYRENVSASPRPRDSSSKSVNQSEPLWPSFEPAFMIQEVT